jgi:general secretion pathway protein E
MAGRGFISGLIFQTLVPTLCKHCRVDYHPGIEELPEALHERIRAVVKDGDTLFIESKNGCEHCNHTGISGRTVCAEMVIPDGTLRDFVLSNSLKEAHNHWRNQRASKPADSMIGATALDHAILKMRRGEVSPTAVEGALGLLNDFSLESAIVGEAGDLLGLGS